MQDNQMKDTRRIIFILDNNYPLSHYPLSPQPIIPYPLYRYPSLSRINIILHMSFILLSCICSAPVDGHIFGTYGYFAVSALQRTAHENTLIDRNKAKRYHQCVHRKRTTDITHLPPSW